MASFNVATRDKSTDLEKYGENTKYKKTNKKFKVPKKKILLESKLDSKSNFSVHIHKHLDDHVIILQV